MSVPGHIGIDGSEIADQLAWHSSSLSLTGLEPAFGMSTEVARGIIRAWMSRKHVEYEQYFCGKRLRAVLKDRLVKELGNYSTWAETS